jgi:hypothetical protein
MRLILLWFWNRQRAWEARSLRASWPDALLGGVTFVLFITAIAHEFGLEAQYLCMLAFGICIYADDWARSMNEPYGGRFTAGGIWMFCLTVIIFPAGMTLVTALIQYVTGSLPEDPIAGRLSFAYSHGLYDVAAVLTGLDTGLALSDVLLYAITRRMGLVVRFGPSGAELSVAPEN